MSYQLKNFLANAYLVIYTTSLHSGLILYYIYTILYYSITFLCIVLMFTLLEMRDEGGINQFATCMHEHPVYQGIWAATSASVPLKMYRKIPDSVQLSQTLSISFTTPLSIDRLAVPGTAFEQLLPSPPSLFNCFTSCSIIFHMSFQNTMHGKTMITD